MTTDQQERTERSEHQGMASEIATRLAPGLSYLRDRIVNVAFIASVDGHDDPWVLVDAGLPGSTSRIIHAAETLFGSGSAPAAIVQYPEPNLGPISTMTTRTPV